MDSQEVHEVVSAHQWWKHYLEEHEFVTEEADLAALIAFFLVKTELPPSCAHSRSAFADSSTN